ncbi:hypothetical protein [Absidia glauca]|uniref:Amino acid permease/ SLC12A domain-containing protein n=1 Tax=Absidia glauca TaxID=4829 RepID=A0A163JZQ1_ABSGL|nr:hypothetical protein [Absidia glauca]
MSNEKTLKEDYAATSIETLESVTDNSIVQQPHQLSRGLKARHIQMIALGGTIGTGLFMASGKAIANGGPGGALVGYGIVGILVFCVMMSLGEMAAFIPVSGSFGHFAARFADPSLGFCVSVIYWCNWAVGVAVELTGVALIMEFWVQTAFSFNGVEIVGITAGESENPHKTVPSAVKQVFWRIILFYIFSMLIIGLIIPYNDPTLLDGASDISVSPFTTVFQKAGAKSAADIMNAIILITMISAGNSGVYSSSRTLMGLAESGFAPKIFTRVNRWGVPIYAVLASCLVGCLAFLTSLFGSGVVFNWLTRLTSLAGLITWVIISVTHIRFRQGYLSQGRSLADLPYVAPLFPICDIFVIVIGLIVIFGQGYASFMGDINAGNVIGSYIGLILAVVLYAGHKIIARPSLVKNHEMDFETGTLKIEKEVFDTNGDGELNPDKKEWPLWKRVGSKVLSIIA